MNSLSTVSTFRLPANPIKVKAGWAAVAAMASLALILPG
jgi:hypothetical protein